MNNYLGTTWLVIVMRSWDLLAITFLVCFASGPVAAQPLQLAPSQVFAVTTEGPSSIENANDLALPGVAFAVSSDILLTAPMAIGSDDAFRAEPRFSQGGVPMRRISLRDLVGTAQETMAHALSTDRAVILVRNDARPALRALPLSACPMADAEHLVQVTATEGIAVLPTRAGKRVTHFRVPPQAPSWEDAGLHLGAPVLRNNMVIGILTDASADGRSLEVTSIAEIADALPMTVDIDCDPRFQQRIKEVKRTLLDLEKDLKNQSERVRALAETVAIALRAMADVAEDLKDLQEAMANGRDTQPILKRMGERLETSVPLMTTISSIENHLLRPMWQVQAKMKQGRLSLTYSYSTQIPGPPYNDEMKLCLRILKPYRTNDPADEDFRRAEFYAAAMQKDDAKLVQCEWAGAANIGTIADNGKYIFEINPDQLNRQVETYFADNDWIPPDLKWSGLSYAVLLRPDFDDTADRDPVILRALIRTPDSFGEAASRPVECRLFETEQGLIDFVIRLATPTDGADVIDVTSSELDPQNTSDVCVLSSAQQ